MIEVSEMERNRSFLELGLPVAQIIALKKRRAPKWAVVTCIVLLIPTVIELALQERDKRAA